jgi:hypothetical protein
MQSRFLNSSIESTLTLIVSGLSMALIAVGTFSMVRPADTALTVAALEPVVIMSQKAPAQVAQAATSLTASAN